jgi:hypothetical protein
LTVSSNLGNSNSEKHKQASDKSKIIYYIYNIIWLAWLAKKEDQIEENPLFSNK